MKINHANSTMDVYGPDDCRLSISTIVDVRNQENVVQIIRGGGSFVFFLTYSLTITSVLDMVFNVRNQTDFGENLYMSAPMVITYCKLCTLLANRDGIMILMEATRRKPYLPVDEEELRIETKFDIINEYAMKINEDFQTALFVQFFGIMAIVCFNLYRITQLGLGEKMVEILVYATCFLMQLFYYCWFGNEVKLKSLEIADLIFSSNWISLSTNTKKTLLMIMLRSTYPIEFTSGHIVSVNLESSMTVNIKQSNQVIPVIIISRFIPGDQDFVFDLQSASGKIVDNVQLTSN